MNRDIITVPNLVAGDIIISTDTSGGIGNKSGDLVQADPQIVAYYCFRVAVMECMSAGGKPIAVIIQNFTGDFAWESYMEGINKGLRELELIEVEITGSSESNFPLNQSAIGITILGKKEESKKMSNVKQKYAVVGKPLVGNEVLASADHTAPLSLFKWCCRDNAISNMLPVGSKGILSEFSLLLGENLSPNEVNCDLDIKKSSGPSTCFIISYLETDEARIKEKLGKLFYPIFLTNDEKS